MLRSQEATRIRANLSLRETIVLASVAEKRVRKDIEAGRLPRRYSADSAHLWFRWLDVFCFAAVYSHTLISAEGRKLVLEKFEEIASRRAYGDGWMAFDVVSGFEDLMTLFKDRLYLGSSRYLQLDLSRVFHDVKPRVELYAAGLLRIEERGDVFAGEPVFCGSRLPVRHVGEMADRGETIENIIEDYPGLESKDIEFARLYFRAHPAMGRPRKAAESSVAAQTASR